MFLVAGVFGGVIGGVFATAASATPASVQLSLASGQWAVQGKTPANTFPATTATKTGFTGNETPATGDISGATLTLPPTPANNTQGKSIVEFLQASAGMATGAVNHKGDVSITDALSVEVQVITPLFQTCLATPVDVTFLSTAPYTKGSGDVTLSATNFTIPRFSTLPGGQHTCATAATTLSGEFSGSTGNKITVSLHGTLTLPPAPGTPTTTTLSATPASPQLIGTSVALKATVKKAGTLAPKATGTMNFYNGTTLLSTKTVAGGTASFTTTTLPGGTSELHATYSGDSNYQTSTSPTVAYLVNPVPTITLSLPSSVTVGAAPTQFSIKVTNPADGQNWPHLWLLFTLNGITQTGSTPILSYKDSGGNWCSVGISGGSDITGIFHGQGTPPCGTGGSFSLSAGSSLTLPLEVSYPARAHVGVQGFVAKLLTVTATGFTAVPPFTFTTSTNPHGYDTYTVNPVTKYTPAISSGSFPTYSITKGFFVVPAVNVESPGSPSGLPDVTGTLQFLVTTTVVTTFPYTTNTGNTTSFSTASLSEGSHTFEAKYLGDHVYNPASYTHTFTVGPPLSGTPFTCVLHSLIGATVTVAAAVTVSASPLPAGAPSGSSISVSNLDVTLTHDNYAGVATPQSSNVIGLSPNGALSVPSVTPVVTNDVATMSWTDLSTTVSISGAVGSKVNVGVKAIDLKWLSFGGATVRYTCTAVFAPASLGTVTVSGTTLSASPASPAVSGTPVTLTATVYPTPTTGSPASQVQFFDGTTGVGTELVSTTGASKGTASVTLTPAVGTYSFTATWTGDPPSIPFNVSNTVSYAVEPVPVGPPTVTTQPVDEAVSVGQTATFTSAAGDTSPSVQWQVSTDGGATWTNVAGAASPTLYFTALGTDSGNQYRAVFTNSAGTATSNPATLSVTTAGYRLVASNGGVYSYGNAPFYGSMGGKSLSAPIVGTASTPGDGGYWLVGSDGGIFSFGNAGFYGSMGGLPLNKPIVGIAATPDGKGYWEVASDGGVFAFGDAQFYGSMGGKSLNKPIVGMAATPTGGGYWEVASDGGIFAFGNAPFYGSTGSLNLNKPIVGMASTSTGGGYLLVASDGGIFSFGNAGFHGTVAGTTSASIVSITPTTDGGGYLETASSGQVFQFGDATSAGTAVSQTATIVAMSD